MESFGHKTGGKDPSQEVRLFPGNPRDQPAWGAWPQAGVPSVEKDPSVMGTEPAMSTLTVSGSCHPQAPHSTKPLRTLGSSSSAGGTLGVTRALGCFCPFWALGGWRGLTCV